MCRSYIFQRIGFAVVYSYIFKSLRRGVVPSFNHLERESLNLATNQTVLIVWTSPALPSSVADPGCFSRIPDLISWITDPAPKQQKRREKIVCCPTIFRSHKYHKIRNNFIFEQVRNFFIKNTRNYSTFTQEFVIKLSKLWVWDPRSELRKKPIPGPGRHRFPDPWSATLLPSLFFDHADRLQFAGFTVFATVSVFWPSVTVLNLLEVILLFRIGNLSNDLSFIA